MNVHVCIFIDYDSRYKSSYNLTTMHEYRNLTTITKINDNIMGYSNPKLSDTCMQSKSLTIALVYSWGIIQVQISLILPPHAT